MKSNLKTTPYFSAYPLKAIKAGSQSSAHHGSTTPKKIISRLRVLPMVNPYPEKVMAIKKPKQYDINTNDIGWFNSYE